MRRPTRQGRISLTAEHRPSARTHTEKAGNAVAEEISIDFETIAYHAGRVDRVASDVALAQSAASSMNLGGGAFGLMCAFLVLPSTIVSTAAQLALASAQGMVERSAREIRGVSSDFSTLESDITDGVTTLRAELDGLR